MSSPSSELPVESKAASEPAAGLHAKLPFSSLLSMSLIVAAVILAVTGGVVYYMLHMGKLARREANCEARSAGVPSSATHVVAIDPLVVNLADPGGRAYLRLVASLRAEDPAGLGSTPKGDKAKSEGVDDVAAIRDTMLGVLGTDTADGLLATDGKERLKSQLLLALSIHVPEMKVKQIYFTEFLVQR